MEHNIVSVAFLIGKTIYCITLMIKEYTKDFLQEITIIGRRAACSIVHFCQPFFKCFVCCKKRADLSSKRTGYKIPSVHVGFKMFSFFKYNAYIINLSSIENHCFFNLS